MISFLQKKHNLKDEIWLIMANLMMNLMMNLMIELIKFDNNQND